MMSATLKSIAMIRLIGWLLAGLQLTVMAPVFATPTHVKSSSTLSVDSAKKIATARYRLHTKEKVRRFSSKLIEMNDKEWVFYFESQENDALAGAHCIVIVDKRSRRAELIPGM